MRKMKDSGVEWIGDIPQEWVLKKIKNAAEYILSGTTPASNNLDYYDGNVYWIQSGDIYGKSVVADTAVKVTELALKIPSLTFYVAPYIVMAMYGGSIGNTAISLIDACTNQACCCVKNDKKNDLHFMYYWLYICKDVFLFQAEGGGQPNISQSKIKNQYYVQPPLSEQEKIAVYLDRKCSEIDSLTADIKKQIETLEEYKRSVITEAVTKGLDPDVEMKDSGVEWIEDIPQGWEINRIKYLFSNGKGLPITKENLIDEGLPVISYGQIHAKFNTGVDISSDLIRFVSHNYERLFPQCEVCQYDFVFADTSEDYDGCGNCIYKRDDSLLYAGYHTIILHSLKRNDNRYFAYLFQTDLWRKQIRCAVSGVKVFSITQKIIMNAQIIIPSPKEQQHIANYLDRKCDEIDSIIKEKQQQLETLAEYKKSLIYEYVTGKKEV